jgi:hypothetical protein
VWKKPLSEGKEKSQKPFISPFAVLFILED